MWSESTHKKYEGVDIKRTIVALKECRGDVLDDDDVEVKKELDLFSLLDFELSDS